MKLKRKVAFNISFVVGLITTFVVGAVAIFHATSNVFLLINISAFVIVVGGVSASAVVMQPLGEIRDLFVKVFKYMRFESEPNWKVAADLVHSASVYAQTRNFSKVGPVQNRRLHECLELIESGMKKQEVLSILATKRECSFTQSNAEAGLLLTLAKLAPGYGLVGTLVGLVVLLYDLGSGDFSKVGPAMAIALLATLYGVLIANMIFMPIAEFFLHRATNVSRLDELLERGVDAMMEGKHPIQTREVIRAYLSSYEQKEYETELKRLKEQGPQNVSGSTTSPGQEATEAKVA